MNHHSVKNWIFFALIGFITIGCAGSRSRLKVGSTEEGEVVEAVGLAPNETTDLMATKRSSLTDAQRKAVEQVVGVYVSARTLVEKAIAIEDNILSQTEGWVKKYDVLKEWVEDGFYKTRIRALVAFKDLEAALKDLSLLNTPELERPRVYVGLSEQIGKKKAGENAATRSLENSLKDQGFVILSDDRKDEAEIMVAGKAASFPFQSEGLGGFISYRARLNVQVTRSGAKDVLVSYSKEASGLGGSKNLAALKSLETVGQVGGEELGEKISEAWAKGRNLLIFVEDVESFDEVNRIRKHLQAQPGVMDLVLRLFDEGMAQFEVQLGNIKATQLASQLESSKSLPMKVLESSNQILRLK